MNIKTAYGNRVFVYCKPCDWTGVRRRENAKSKPCPKCKSTAHLKFIDTAQEIDRRKFR